MLTPRLTNCPQCADIPSLIAEIDCKIAELSVNLYNNIVYILNSPINGEAISDLLHYKRILLYKYCNPEYAGSFTVNNIASKIKLLKYK
jgi:hypothetical protein